MYVLAFFIFSNIRIHYQFVIHHDVANKPETHGYLFSQWLLWAHTHQSEFTFIRFVRFWIRNYLHKLNQKNAQSTHSSHLPLIWLKRMAAVAWFCRYCHHHHHHHHRGHHRRRRLSTELVSSARFVLCSNKYQYQHYEIEWFDRRN